MATAAIEIPADYLAGIQAMAKIEDGDLSAFVLQAMLENWEAASEDRRPMCADTGLPRYFVKAGNEARIEGGFVALEEALRKSSPLLSLLTVVARIHSSMSSTVRSEPIFFPIFG